MSDNLSIGRGKDRENQTLRVEARRTRQEVMGTDIKGIGEFNEW